MPVNIVKANVYFTAWFNSTGLAFNYPVHI
jgi:hypothetical protein